MYSWVELKVATIVVMVGVWRYGCELAGTKQ